MYRKVFYSVVWFHGSALHGDRCETHTNFADESAFLTADNVRNEVVTVHKSQHKLRMLCFYIQTFLSLAGDVLTFPLKFL
jgi:hypothetical protein